LEAIFNHPVCDSQNDLIVRVSVIYEKPIYNLLPSVVVGGTVKGTKAHVTDGTTRDQFALAKSLPDCLLGDQSAVREPVKHIDRGLMIKLPVIRHSAVDTPFASDGLIYTLETHLGFAPVVLLFHPAHGIFRNS
jgi:hypothetical protein